MSAIEKQQDQSLSLIEKLRLKRSSPAIILDCSGSMATEIEPGISRIKALREIVNDLPGYANLYFFHSKYGTCTKETIPDPTGMTRLSPVLMDLKGKGTKNIILLTDGDINDKELTLEAAKDLNIQCMYIGSGDRPAFLDKLANMSGGFATTEDLKQQKQLVNKITLLLGSGETKRQYEL